MEYVLYTRCSTTKQEISIDEQTQQAYKWLANGDTIIKHYSEVVSGTKNDRVELLKAIDYCKANDLTLLATRLDRLSRNASFTMALADSKINFIALDCPNANKMTIGFMSLMNQDYAEKVSTNTKKALQYLKSQGRTLGKIENLNDNGRQLGADTNKEKAKQLNHQATKIIVRLKKDGQTLEAIADELNADGYTTSTGKDFCKRSVSRLYLRATKKHDHER